MKELLKKEKNKKLEIVFSIFWIIFGIFNGLTYYSKAEFIISGIMFLIAVLYGYKLIIPFIKR